MGYDLHITRRKNWADQGDDITAEEWLTYVKRDPAFRLRPENGKYFAEWNSASGNSWLDWSDGEIYTKNPDDTMIAKMVTIAQQFNATVQGDDGEIYDDSQIPRQPHSSLGSRIGGWFAKLRPKPQPKTQRAPLPFAIGDKVVDAWGSEHTILSIDPDAEHGLGVIRSRRSKDGTEHSSALIAHGFKPKTKSDAA